MKKRGHKKNRKVVGLEKLVFHPTSYNCKQSSILVECIHNEKTIHQNQFMKKIKTNEKRKTMEVSNSSSVCRYSSIQRFAKMKNRKARTFYSDEILRRKMKLHMLTA